MPEILLNTIALDPNRWLPNRRPFFPLTQLLPAIAAAGFRRLEVWQYHLHWLKEPEIRELAALATSLDVRCTALGLYPKLRAIGAERKAQWKHVHRLIEIAAFLDCRTVKIWFGDVGSGVISNREEERSIAFLHDLLELAARYGLTVTGELHANTLLDSVDSALCYLDLLAAPNLKICFQPLDFTDTESTIQAYQSLAPHVTHLHFQGQRKGEFCLLSESDIDYSAFIRALQNEALNGLWCIEFVRNCLVAQAREFDLDRVLDAARQDYAWLTCMAENVHTK